MGAMSLFDLTQPPEPPDDAARPLADRMRPRTLDEFIGQEKLLAPANRSAKSKMAISFI